MSYCKAEKFKEMSSADVFVNLIRMTNDKSMTTKILMKTKLIAPCGMNCAICLGYLRERNKCDGCWSPERKCDKNCTSVPAYI